MIICLFLIWFLNAIWVVYSIADSKSQCIAAVITTLLGPLSLPAALALYVIIEEKKKWKRNAWYRDNWPRPTYTIIKNEDIP